MTLDDRLRAAADEVRHAVGAETPPPFEPKRSSGGRVAAAMLAVIAVVGIGVYAVSQEGDGPDPVVVAVSAPDPPQETAAPVFTDPEFGTDVRRVTESSPDEVTTPLFSGTPSYNADGSLVVLYRTGGEREGHVLFDGATLAEIGPVDLDAVDIEDFYWDGSDPQLLRFVRQGSNELVELDLADNTTSVTHVFEGCETVDTGATSGRPAPLGPILGFVCHPADGAPQLMAYDTTTGAETRSDVTPADGSGAPVPMVSGEGFVVRDDAGVTMLGPDLQPVNGDAGGENSTIYTGPVSSYVLATDADGRDLLVAVLFEDPESNGIVAFDLATGERSELLSEATGAGYPPSNLHLAVAASAKPWLVAATNYPDEGEGEFVDEIVLLDVAQVAEPVVNRLAHHRRSRTPVLDGWRDVYLTTAPDGSRILFGSDWGTEESVDTFAIDLG